MRALILTFAFMTVGSFAVNAQASNVELTQDGLSIYASDSLINLKPKALINNTWISPKNDDCFLDRKGASYHCNLNPYGVFSINKTGSNDYTFSFQADKELTLEALSVEGDGSLDGAKYWLSNGKQSWSLSGNLTLEQTCSDRELKNALNAKTSDEENRKGKELSWDFTYVTGGNKSLFIGALSIKALRNWIQPSKTRTGDLKLRIVSGGAGSKIKLSKGDSFETARWHVKLTDNLEKTLEDYSFSLKSRKFSHPHENMVGWNSWYELWAKVSEADIRANAKEIKNVLAAQFEGMGKQAPKPVVVIDDGWEIMWGEWTANKKFPSGLKKLASDLKDMGTIPGIWMAPFLVSTKSSLVKKKPEWFVGEVTYYHTSGTYKILDVTHEEAAHHFQENIRRLVDAGFEKLKVDFLIAGSYEGKRSKDITGMQAYELGMKLIREAAGEDVFILACGGIGLASFPYTDGWRIGPDILFEGHAKLLGPVWQDAAVQARNIAARWFLCNTTVCDTDPILLRKGYSRENAEAAAWVAAFGGNGLYYSDNLSKLPQNRKSWGMTPYHWDAALSGKPSRPEPLIQGNVPSQLEAVTTLDRALWKLRFKPASVWKTPSGERVGINFNIFRRKNIEGVLLKAKTSVVLP